MMYFVWKAELVSDPPTHLLCAFAPAAYQKLISLDLTSVLSFETRKNLCLMQ